MILSSVRHRFYKKLQPHEFNPAPLVNKTKKQKRPHHVLVILKTILYICKPNP